MEFRSGFIAFCGRPNVGKSSLLNQLVGVELAVTTPFPQTTRETHFGVWTTPNFQAVLVDTPGIHQPRSAMNRFMVQQALYGAKDVDLILLLAELPQLTEEEAELWQPGEGARLALQSLVSLGKPIALVLTKSDQVKNREIILPVIDKWRQMHDFCETLITSARTKEGLDELRSLVESTLKPGPLYFDKDALSDRSARWHAAERIRKAIFHSLKQELPYRCAVTIEMYKEQEHPPKDHIRAVIHVEQESQKAIVVGHKGTMIRKISMAARKEISEFNQRPCDLFINVKVTPNWTQNPKLMEQLGYHGPIGGES